ncbi:dimer_Tnp_hAT domain-containing protein [Trichonephila clavipes]|nr:dimer_Tnp_hAT domain-containing protein [Trichonephila clavipes]
MPNIKIVDNKLFEEFGRLNVYENYNKLKQLENQHTEIDKRWAEMLNHFKNEHIPYENLVILFEFRLCCPGTNAPVERVLSVGNFGTRKKSRILDFLKSVLSKSLLSKRILLTKNQACRSNCWKTGIFTSETRRHLSLE